MSHVHWAPLRLLVLLNSASLSFLLAPPARAEHRRDTVTSDIVWLAPGPAAANELSLQDGDVAVSCTYRNQYDGTSGAGTPSPLTVETGNFYFSSPTNYEVFVKVLDWFPENKFYQLFWGGLTNLEYTLTFRQTSTGQSVIVQKGAGSVCGGFDTAGLQNPGPSFQEITISLPGGVSLAMVKIPPGTFRMGAPENERSSGPFEGPVHQVTLTSAYYMGKYEVTQKQWKAVTGKSRPASCPDYGVGDDYPMSCVSWYEVAGPGGFIDKLNQLQGTTKFRLPTEAEWERAARGGTQTRFSFGDTLECDDLCGACPVADQFIWWCGNHRTAANPGGAAYPVGQKKANQYGLYDMHGNVWEWVQDRHVPYAEAALTDPTGPTTGTVRVIRSGSGPLGDCRSANRMRLIEVMPKYDVGFRLVRGQ